MEAGGRRIEEYDAYASLCQRRVRSRWNAGLSSALILTRGTRLKLWIESLWLYAIDKKIQFNWVWVRTKMVDNWVTCSIGSRLEKAGPRE